MRFITSVFSAAAITSATAFVPSSPSSIHRSHTSLSSTATETATGTVKWYNAQRGFGFIEVDDGSPDMYVHATGLTFQGPLLEDDRVTFSSEIDTRTNKPKAVNVMRTDAEAPSPVADEPPAVESVVEKVMEVVKEELDEDAITQKAIKAESFQRARLDAQLQQGARDASLAAEKAAAEEARVAAEKAAAEEARVAAEKAAAEEARVAALAKAAAEEARIAKEAEEARIKAEQEEAARIKAEQEEAARIKAEQEEAARVKAEEEARLAEEKRLAEEARLAKEAEEKRLEEERLAAAAAAAAAKEAEESKARELGYPSVAVMKARQQPKSQEEEAALAAKYGAMDLEERAFTILADLGLELNPDPDDPNRDTSKDEEDME